MIIVSDLQVCETISNISLVSVSGSIDHWFLQVQFSYHGGVFEWNLFLLMKMSLPRNIALLI